MRDALVILDIGGTLVQGPDTGPAKRLAARLGLSPDARRAFSRAIMTRAFASPEELAAAVDLPAGAVAELWRAQEDEARPVEGALDALRALQAQGIRLALLSNIWPPYLTSVRRHFGAFFDAHVEPELQRYSFALGDEKPAARLFTDLLRDAGVPAGRCVMVGDSYSSDLEPAMRLGMKAVWTLHRPKKEVTDLVRVLNRAAPPPSRTVASVAAVDAALIRALVEAA